MTTIILEKLTIGFKSDPVHYKLEVSDNKNNTIRKIDWQDKRFIELMLMKLYDCYGYIEITNSVEENIKFKRKIRNVDVWKNLMIITWDEQK